MGHPRGYFKDLRIGQTPFWDLHKAASGSPTLDDLVNVLDFLHIAEVLLAAYGPDYPLVEPQELIPSFDAPLIEYNRLPAFSMLVLDRSLSYQDEGFQYDQLWPESKPHDPGLTAQNRQIIKDRLPRDQVPQLERDLGRRALTPFSRYAQLLPHIIKMDRGHIIARDPAGVFYLAGVFASFPSDLDGEIKRFGRQIGKFRPNDNQAYAANRLFVYRFLMEQTGFAICGERHTSAALFARRLKRRRERFAIKVLGSSDRTITTLTSLGAKGRLPRVEKTALVKARGCTSDGRHMLRKEGFMVDKGREVVILRVSYLQHAYHPDNVLEDRALSVLKQEVIHPRTGLAREVDVLGINRDRLVVLNDIVRGEAVGSIIYHEREEIRASSDIRNRLRFLAAWLSKNRRLLAEYGPDHFERVLKVLLSFLEDPAHAEDFARHDELYQEVRVIVNDLRMAHRLRLLEKLVRTRADHSGRRLQHVHVLVILSHILSQEGGELARKHPDLLRKLLAICHRQLDNNYIKRRYLAKPPKTTLEREVTGHYKLLRKLVERFSAELPV